jgi:hypothetical protein
VAASFEIRTKPDLVLDPVYKYEGRWSIPRAGCACDLDFDLCRRGEREERQRCSMCRFKKRSPPALASAGTRGGHLPVAEGKNKEGFRLAACASARARAELEISGMVVWIHPISNFIFASAPAEDSRRQN